MLKIKTFSEKKKKKKKKSYSHCLSNATLDGYLAVWRHLLFGGEWAEIKPGFCSYTKHTKYSGPEKEMKSPPNEQYWP